MRISQPLGFILFCLFTQMTSAMDTAQLLKVDAKNNKQCVEYYHYQGGLYCSVTAQSQEVPDKNIKDFETFNIIFDDRPWHLAWGKKTSNVTTLEYVPAGEKINDWHELVTSQFFPGLTVSPKEFAELFISNLKKSGFEPQVSFHEDTDRQVIFEFRLSAPTNQIQDEIQLVRKEKDGLYVLHYVIKKDDMGEAARKKWLTNLKKSELKNESFPKE